MHDYSNVIIVITMHLLFSFEIENVIRLLLLGWYYSLLKHIWVENMIFEKFQLIQGQILNIHDRLEKKKI